MHIGFIIYDSLDTVTGSYLYNRHLVEYLEECGDKVDIISIPWGSLHKTIPQNWLSSLYQKLTTTQYDVLIQDEFNHPSLFLLNQRIKSQVNYPILSLVHRVRSYEKHSRLRMPAYRWIEQQYLRSVDGFIYNGFMNYG